VNRKIAEQLVAAVKKIDMVVGEIDEIAETLDDPALRKKTRTTIFNIVADAHEGITLDVAREYPDLHPDRAEIDAERAKKQGG
jgi:hypothetical protein